MFILMIPLLTKERASSPVYKFKVKNLVVQTDLNLYYSVGFM